MKNLNLIQLKTNMRCESCVAKVRPAFEAAGLAQELSFDMASPDKRIQFRGENSQVQEALRILESLGYHGQVVSMASVLPAVQPQAPAPQESVQPSFYQTYKPLILVFLFLFGVTALVELGAGEFRVGRAMNVFMGGFFLFFAFFKMLDLAKFADAFLTYDVLAARSRLYAFAYPFIEVLLGAGYVLGWAPTYVNGATAVLMSVSSIGVVQALRQKRAIQCACLGTVFNLPMTKVTVVENGVMFLMALTALFLPHLYL
jgi:cation transport ATPase